MQSPHPAPITVNRTLINRAALITLLTVIGLLAGLNLTSHLALDVNSSPASVNVAANFAYYAEGGYPIQFCQTASMTGYTGATASHCEILTHPQSLSQRTTMLDEGDYLWVKLDAKELSITQLMKRWGTPHLQPEAEGGVRLVWDLPAFQVTGSLNWGKPHQTPEQAILTLKRANSGPSG